MKVTKLSWVLFRLPLRATFHSASGGLSHRQGLILRLVTDSGVVGVGEASPHPLLSPVAVQDIQAVLERLAPDLLQRDVEELGPWLEEMGADIPPALACAVDVAACDALAWAQGVSVARFLKDQARARVSVNATVAAEMTAAAVAEAAAARAQGFGCVKLKVGMAPSIEEECQRVAAVRRALGPDIRLRLDANGAWRPSQAVGIIEALARYDLEMVEQPLGGDDIEGMAWLRTAVGVPLAADEAVTDVEAARRVLEAGAADVLVIKPMVVGGLRPARRIIELAAAAGVKAIVTTTIDAGVGTAAALHLAATLAPDSPACGLATGSFLAADLIGHRLAVHNGCMELPPGPGLGVGLDEGELTQYGRYGQEVP